MVFEPPLFLSIFFFFNDTATTEIYTLSLHDALPIWRLRLACAERALRYAAQFRPGPGESGLPGPGERSEEHTSELQSQSNLVCRLLLEKKKKHTPYLYSTSSVVAHLQSDTLANPSAI